MLNDVMVAATNFARFIGCGMTPVATRRPLIEVSLERYPSMLLIRSDWPLEPKKSSRKEYHDCQGLSS
jgi:hypothetical protein